MGLPAKYGNVIIGGAESPATETPHQNLALISKTMSFDFP